MKTSRKFRAAGLESEKARPGAQGHQRGELSSPVVNAMAVYGKSGTVVPATGENSTSLPPPAPPGAPSVRAHGTERRHAPAPPAVPRLSGAKGLTGRSRHFRPRGTAGVPGETPLAAGAASRLRAGRLDGLGPADLRRRRRGGGLAAG